jgi:hypothetical protein
MSLQVAGAPTPTSGGIDCVGELSSTPIAGSPAGTCEFQSYFMHSWHGVEF